MKYANIISPQYHAVFAKCCFYFVYMMKVPLNAMDAYTLILWIIISVELFLPEFKFPFIFLAWVDSGILKFPSCSFLFYTFRSYSVVDMTVYVSECGAWRQRLKGDCILQWSFQLRRCCAVEADSPTRCHVSLRFSLSGGVTPFSRMVPNALKFRWENFCESPSAIMGFS